jgi:hypothetical protein
MGYDVEPLAEYWCELAPQSYVDSPSGDDGPGYGQMSAVEPDQWRYDLGFGQSATGFTVTGVCVLQVGTAASAGYDFMLISPAGRRIPMPPGLVPEPMTPMPEWGDPQAPYTGLQACWGIGEQVDDGRGVWRLQVFPSSTMVVPVPAAWANGISCVRLDEAADAGFLAVEFTGVEVTTTTTTTPPPTTTTTTTTTTPAPTTSPPTTTTTTTPEPTTTTTTTTTTPPPLWDQLGFFGKLFLLIALAITAAAAVSFFVWACQGYLSLGLFAAAVSLAAAAAVLLPAWTLLFRTGRTMDLLSTWFAVLSAGTPLLAAALAIIGNLNCAAGALIVSGLFGTLLSLLTLARRIQLRRRLRSGLRRD